MHPQLLAVSQVTQDALWEIAFGRQFEKITSLAVCECRLPILSRESQTG